MIIKAEIKTNKQKFKIIKITPKLITIQTKAQAKEGKANKEIITKLKKILKSNVEIIKGQKSNKKTLLIENDKEIQKIINQKKN